MIRIAHFSDLHYGTKNLAEADRCFGAAIDRAIALGAEAAVISGDATDHGLDLHAPAAERLVAQVRRLADHCPVLMLQGTFSHEPPGTLAIFRLLGGRHPVHVAEPYRAGRAHGPGEWLSSTGWCFDGVPAGARALFSCIPTVNKAVVAATVGAADAPPRPWASIWPCCAATPDPIARPVGRACRPSACRHGTVFGCVSEHGVPMAGFDHEFLTGACSAAGRRPSCSGTSTGIRHGNRESRGAAMHRLSRLDRSLSLRRGRGQRVSVLGSRRRPGALHPGAHARAPDRRYRVRGQTRPRRPARTVAQQDIASAFVRVRWTVADEDRHRSTARRSSGCWTGGGGNQAGGRIVPVVRTRAAGFLATGESGGQGAGLGAGDRGAAEPLLACLQALANQEPEAIAERMLRGQEVPDGGECIDTAVTRSPPRADLEPALSF